MNRKLVFAITLCVALMACDEGLAPDVDPGISGTLTVVGPWPPQDSVKTLWIFASQIYPIDSSKVVAGIVQSRILVYPSLEKSLPYNVNVQSFRFDLPPSTYFYIGVLQRFGDSLFDPKSYRVVGVLTDPGNPQEPRVVTISDDKVVANLSITVDFYNLPPQPF